MVSVYVYLINKNQTNKKKKMNHTEVVLSVLVTMANTFVYTATSQSLACETLPILWWSAVVRSQSLRGRCLPWGATLRTCSGSRASTVPTPSATTRAKYRLY
jgi:hypothetical protein